MTRKAKTWTVWDFPDNIYILIKMEIREEFFKNMYKKFGSQKDYAKFVGKSLDSIENYYRGPDINNSSRLRKLLPITLLKKSYHLLSKTLREKIENNTEIIRGTAGAYIVNPKLPINESPKIYRIAAHLLADGSADNTHVPYYCNSSEELREQFKKDLQIFGYVKVSEGRLNPTPCVYFPKFIADILRHILKVKFNHPQSLPHIVFKATEKRKKEFLRAFFDDEGTVCVRVAICLKNQNLIREVKLLVRSLGIQTSKIYKKTDKLRGNITYAFSIINADTKIYQQKIGFSHPTKNQKLIDLIEIRTSFGKNKSIPATLLKKMIINSLKTGCKTTVQLHYELKIGYHQIHKNLKKMEFEGSIRRSGFRNNILWKTV